MDGTFWFFTLLFFVALFYDIYKNYGGVLLLKGLNLVIQKSTEEGISVAKKTATGTIRLKFKFSNKEYEAIFPFRGKVKKWVRVEAEFNDEDDVIIKDVTDIVLKYAGPKKDFFGFKLKPNQIVRGAKKLIFYDKENNVLEI